MSAQAIVRPDEVQTDSIVCDVPLQSADHQSLSRITPSIWKKIFTFAYDYKYKTPLSTIIRHRYFIHGELPGSCNQKHILHVIRRVCQNWREIVQSIPTLWTDIWLHDCWEIPKGAKRNLPGFISSRSYTLSNFLKFSHDLPLRIFLYPEFNLYIDSDDFDHHSVAGLVHHVTLFLAQQSHRWSTLYICESHCQSVSRALSASLPLLNVTTLPLLTHLHFQWWGTLDGYQYDSVGEDLALRKSDFTLLGTPTLRFLSIGFICPRDRSLEWAYLEKVTFNKIEHHHCRRVLPLLLSAVEITILEWKTDFDDDDVEEAEIAVRNNVVDFTLPRLKMLSVYQWDFKFFAFMKAPSLRNLHICILKSHVREVAEFINHSSCSIETFTSDLMRPPLVSSPDDAYPDLFSSMPNLQKLNLEVLHSEYVDLDGKGGDRIHTVLCALSRRVEEDGQAKPVNFPGLRTLSVSLGLHNHPEFLIELVDEIRVRWAHSKTMANAGTGLCCVEGLPEDDKRFPEKYQACFESLREMEMEGLRVSYGTGIWGPKSCGYRRAADYLYDET